MNQVSWPFYQKWYVSCSTIWVVCKNLSTTIICPFWSCSSYRAVSDIIPLAQRQPSEQQMKVVRSSQSILSYNDVLHYCWMFLFLKWCNSTNNFRNLPALFNQLYNLKTNISSDYKKYFLIKKHDLTLE